MVQNMFADLPIAAEAEERFDTLLVRPGLRIERIVSTGQYSPEGFWYDQGQGEWILVLSGSAGLRFADEVSTRDLRPGDWLYIAPHRRHRVERTQADAVTVWLALHFDERAD